MRPITNQPDLLTIATFEVTADDEKIQELLQGDRGMAVLLEPILNQILQAEMTFCLGAKPGERIDSRSGYRDGTYVRQLTTRVGRLELEVSRDEKAHVLTLMQMVVQGISTRRVKEITTELCRRKPDVGEDGRN